VEQSHSLASAIFFNQANKFRTGGPISLCSLEPNDEIVSYVSILLGPEETLPSAAFFFFSYQRPPEIYYSI
jgi:hypothetical protein